MAEKTLYSVLEVADDASGAVIEAAYQRLRSDLEPAAGRGDEDALNRLRAMREAHQTLTHADLRKRYDLSLARRTAVTQSITYAEPSFALSKVAVIGLVLALAGSAWFYAHRQQVQRVKAEQVLKEKSEALAQAEAERQRLTEEASYKEQLQKQRQADLANARWADQARREGAENMRRNALARQRSENEERLQQQRIERQAVLEQATQETAARRRLEEEKARLRLLEYRNRR